MNESNTTEQSFLEAINNWIPEQRVEVEYRLYYKDCGTPIAMSSDNHPFGKYIVITKEQYNAANYNVRVVNGKLSQVELDTQFKVQLIKSNSGMSVVKGHAGIIVCSQDAYTNIEYYGQRNN